MLIAWCGFIALIVVLLAIDLFLVNREAHVIGAREALIWTAVYVALALLFSLPVYFMYNNHWLGLGLHAADQETLSGRDAVVQYLTGWMVEYALSMDNIFVIAVILTHFRAPPSQQHRVLFWGVLGAILMRGAMILAGAALIHAFSWMIYVFGLVLIVTAVRLLVIEEEMDLEGNAIIRIAKRYFPFSGDYEGGKFFTRLDGRLLGTPLLLVMIVVQTTDALFAFDSIPAIFAITNDSFLIFSSNMFAILGLRSLFFALAAVIAKFRYLKLSLVFVLGFVGVKMLLHEYVHISPELSLGVVAAMFGGGIAASMWANRVEKHRPTPIEDIAEAAEYAWKRSRKIVIFVIGATIILFGLIVGILPGVPGIPIMIIGFMLLATEFIWAKILLGKLKRKALELKGAAERFAGMTPQQSEAGESNPHEPIEPHAPAEASQTSDRGG